MLCRVIQDRWVIVKRSDKIWSIGGGNGNSLQHSCLENLMNSMKRQKGMTQKDESLRSEGVQYATGEEQRVITKSFKNGLAKVETTVSLGCVWW